MLFYDLTLEIHIIISFTVHSQNYLLLEKTTSWYKHQEVKIVGSPLKG